MRRDMDLVREILQQIEAWPEPQDWVEFDLPDRLPDEVNYHVAIMVEAGLIQAQDVSTLQMYDWRAKKLTWTGHEFLDDARDDKVWSGAKKRLGAQFASASFEVIRAVLVDITKTILGLQ